MLQILCVALVCAEYLKDGKKSASNMIIFFKLHFSSLNKQAGVFLSCCVSVYCSPLQEAKRGIMCSRLSLEG